MATQNLPQSKENSLIMFSKLLLCSFLLMLIVSCGGRASQMQPPAPVITAAQVFSNHAETWAFVNQYGDQTWIDVIPQPDGSTIWHYHKNADRAYWTPGAPAELWFYLSPDGSRWYSTGGHIIVPQGFPWDKTHTPQDFVYVTQSDPGMPRAYLILADSGTTVDTTFPDTQGPHTRWKTSMYVEDGELISEQWEGQCIHEKWHFAVGRGLVKVEDLDTGSCTPADPNLTMNRIN